MPIEFVDFETARDAGGLRMVVVGGVPSPWGEAAKGILHVKQIPYRAVRLDQGSDEMAAWAGERTGPVAIYEDEAPRSGWDQILILAERLAPESRLIPADAAERAVMFGLAHEICSEGGLGWMRRLQGVHSGLHGGEGFPEGVALYLAGKYGYREEEAAFNQRRVVDLLEMLAGRLHAQRRDGSRFYLGSSLTALDIYSAAFTALLSPLPPEDCPMPDAMRVGFEAMDEETRKAFDPILVEHRDFIYDEYLELPLSL